MIKYLLTPSRKINLYWHIFFIFLGLLGGCLFGLNLLSNIQVVNIKPIEIPNDTTFIAIQGNFRNPNKVLFKYNGITYKAHCNNDNKNNNSITCGNLFTDGRKLTGRNVKFLSIIDRYAFSKKIKNSILFHKESEGLIITGTFQYNQESEEYFSQYRDSDIYFFKNRVLLYVDRALFLLFFCFFTKGLFGFFYYDNLFHQQLTKRN